MAFICPEENTEVSAKLHKGLALSYRPQSSAVWSLLLARIVVVFSERSIWGFRFPGVEHRGHFKVKRILPVCCPRRVLWLMACLSQGRWDGLVSG